MGSSEVSLIWRYMYNFALYDGAEPSVLYREGLFRRFLSTELVWREVEK